MRGMAGFVQEAPNLTPWPSIDPVRIYSLRDHLITVASMRRAYKANAPPLAPQVCDQRKKPRGKSPGNGPDVVSTKKDDVDAGRRLGGLAQFVQTSQLNSPATPKNAPVTPKGDDTTRLGLSAKKRALNLPLTFLPLRYSLSVVHFGGWSLGKEE